VPVLVDANTIIYESRIIIRILIELGVNRTYPAYERPRNEMFTAESEGNLEVIA